MCSYMRVFTVVVHEYADSAINCWKILVHKTKRLTNWRSENTGSDFWHAGRVNTRV